MTKTTLATFRVDEAKWKQFQSIAKDSGYSASALIVGFIDRNIDSGIEPPPERVPTSIDRDIDKQVKELVDEYLERRIDKMVLKDDLNDSIETTVASAIQPIEMRLTQLENSLSDLDVTYKQNPRKPEGSLSVLELVEKLGKTRQSIEARRNNGKLSEWGYTAIQTGKTWFYFPIDR
jgi:hypothetical protein